LYKQLTINYDIIPFLTLITSCLSIINGVIGRLYIGMIHNKRGKKDINFNEEGRDENIENGNQGNQIEDMIEIDK